MLDRDGQQASATQARQQALADADHLAVLHAIWTAETAPAREQRYRDLLAAALPPEHRREPGHQARWLWRTLRGAELAGLDPAQVLAEAIGERDLAGARDLAAVIDARIRYRLGSLIPRPAGPWSAQVPAIADPERHAWLTQIAALMDARKDRIGEHAADHELPWAVAALGPVPAHPLDQLAWQQQGRLHRRLAGTIRLPPPHRPDRARARRSRPRDCGPPGTRLSPDSAPPTDQTSAACPTGRCCTCATPTPPKRPGHPGTSATSSRQVRAAAWNARLAALRATAEAKAASGHGQHDTAAQQQELAGSYHALHDAYRQRESVFATVMADRSDWDAATRIQRHLAVAADAELRRRHPDQHYPPLRSAEPQPATGAQRDELTLTAAHPTPEMGQWIKDLAAAHHTFAGTARRTAEPDHPVRRPRLRGPGPGIPALARPGQGRHLAAAQTRDPPLPASPPAGCGPRRRPGGR